MDVVVFNKCIQDMQELGTDEFMISRLFFDLYVKGRTYTDQHCTIKQTVGSSFEDDRSFEVYVDFLKHGALTMRNSKTLLKAIIEG